MGADLIRQNKAIAAEADVSDRQDARTWLTSHNPVRILDRTLLISSSIDITEYKQIERELVERAHIDELTGLPDRILIQEHVEAIIRNDDGSQLTSRSHSLISTTSSTSTTTTITRSAMRCW